MGLNSATEPSGSSLCSRTTLLGVGLTALAVSIGYAWYTGHIWEDFFITFRHSVNLAEGRGLTYDPPVRVHGFTSPLGVLLPCLCYLATGARGYLPALWWFRVASALAWAAATILFALAGAQGQKRWRPFALAAAGLVIAFEAKAVAFSVNGMETAWLLLFLAWAFGELAVRSTIRAVPAGLAWAGLLWTRPDGCIWILGLTLGHLLWCPVSRRRSMIGLLQAGLVCALAYAPWLAWAWWYYGSPIPHTVLAKTIVEWDLARLLRQVWNDLGTRFPTIMAQPFQPILFNQADWLPWQRANEWIAILSGGLGAVAAGYWLVPTTDRVGRIASWCYALGGLYLCFFVPVLFPWYWAPFAVLGLLVWIRIALIPWRKDAEPLLMSHVSAGATLGRGCLAAAYFALIYPIHAWYAATAIVIGLPALAQTIRCRQRQPFSRGTKWLPAAAQGVAGLVLMSLLLGQWSLFGFTALEMRIQQTEVEDGNRRRLGLWLREHAHSQDRVFLEPLGYIGYFSGCHMLDYPGLATPQVVRLRRVKHLSFYGLIEALQPEWVVLRDREVAAPAAPETRSFYAHYLPVCTFDVRPNLEHYSWMPGRSYTYYDAAFQVFHRRSVNDRAF